VQAIFAVTDPDWLVALGRVGGGEVNFWQPRPTRAAQVPGTPYIFKIRGSNRIGGFGFFSYWTEMPLAIAWETFREANGVASMGEMRSRVNALRRETTSDDRVGCIVLSDTVILPSSEYVAAPRDWKPNIVRIAGYDMETGEGARVWAQLRALDSRAAQPAQSALLQTPGGYSAPVLVAARRGQGAFRLMVMDAYARRCAVTGERTLPVLEAAHIRPFAERATHEIRNGILMRSDVHRLYDLGLVTVAPDLTFHVSKAIDREYSNGKIYYALDGSTVSVPEDPNRRPDPEALQWHASEVFRQ
jgi:putative restriction endonuclease